MRLAKVRPSVLSLSIISLRRPSSQGMRPPPELTCSTPSCRIPTAPRPASRQIFGRSARGPAAASTLETPRAGIASAARPAVFSIVRRVGLVLIRPMLLSASTHEPNHSLQAVPDDGPGVLHLGTVVSPDLRLPPAPQLHPE